jgi:hypothetical protein
MSNDDTTDDDMPVSGHEPGSRGDATLNGHMARLAVRMVEMEQGLRPASALDLQASPLAARRIRHLIYRAKSRRRQGARRTAPAAVLSTTSFHPTAGVAEGAVILSCDGRVRAFCVRLEQERGRWRIVDLAPPEGGLAPAVTMASRTGASPGGATDEHRRPRRSRKDRNTSGADGQDRDRI